MSEFVEHVMDKGMEKLMAYCCDEKNKNKIEDTLFRPLISYLIVKFAWLKYTLQALSTMVVIQTVILLVLLFRFR
jgi:hypothetical protein